MSVVIGWIDGGTTTGRFTECVTQLATYEAYQGRLASVVRVLSGPLLEEGRNTLVEKFLTVDAEWLFMVDTDMTFQYDAIERLMATAEVTGAKVVGGLCYGLNTEHGQFPTLYENKYGLPALLPNPGGIVEVDGTGMAFVLTHRSVFEDHKRTGSQPWFHRRHIEPTSGHPGGVLGEDLSWCWWLRDCGVTIVVDTDVEAGHMKQTEMNTHTFEAGHASS